MVVAEFIMWCFFKIFQIDHFQTKSQLSASEWRSVHHWCLCGMVVYCHAMLTITAITFSIWFVPSLVPGIELYVSCWTQLWWLSIEVYLIWLNSFEALTVMSYNKHVQCSSFFLHPVMFQIQLSDLVKCDQHSFGNKKRNNAPVKSVTVSISTPFLNISCAIWVTLLNLQVHCRFLYILKTYFEQIIGQLITFLVKARKNSTWLWKSLLHASWILLK